MKYDDASWHYGSDSFPKSQPDEHGGTHIGLFLKWCFTKGWAGELHLREEPDDTARVSNGSLTGTAFLFKYCDGKLTNEDFNAEGNAFAERYYGEQGLYLDDYARNFGQHEYMSPESAHDFAAFSSMLEQRWRAGVLTKQDIKPWWKFW